jgi:formylglycine-generating enzyme required for sulfatase activity
MRLVLLGPGDFIMGQGEGPPRDRKTWSARDWDESPAHRVTLTRAFYLAAHEVTNAQYEQFDPGHRKLRGKYGSSATDHEPVTHVTWDRAVAFCAWLSRKEGRPYRLPTEAEWEYACRAGATTLFHTGGALSPDQANLGRGKDRKPQSTVRVGSYPPNAWGLYDLHGNVAEWCLDWHGPYPAGPQVDPVGPADGYARVVRGGSFRPPVRADASRYCRSANRAAHLPDDANRCTGFRVVQGELPRSRPWPVVLARHQRDVKQTPAPKGGPDPTRPYFLDYTGAGKNPAMPKDAWGPIFVNHNHYAATCVCPNGDVLFAWYTTVGERGRELTQAVSRLRAGADRWEPAELFLEVADVNCHAPVLLRHGRRVYHFAGQGMTGWDESAIVMRTSDDSGATWTKPRVIWSRDEEVRMSQPCSAFVSKGGALVLACDGDLHKDERLLVSRDGGRSWAMGGGDLRRAAGRYAIHPAVAERADGSTLAFLRGPDPMPLFVSGDLGETWKREATPFPGIGGGQKAAALRLSSGALLLCSIRGSKLVGRTFAALSPDGGKTWPHSRDVPGVGGYMALAQADNGVIYLVGSRMGCVAFNEAWVREGKPAPGGK